MISEIVNGGNADPMLQWRGRFTQLTFEIASGAERWHIKIDNGRVSAGPPVDGSVPAFSLRAEQSAWADFLKPTPPAGTHDIVALFESGQLAIDGDALALFRNLLYVKLLLEKGRQAYSHDTASQMAERTVSAIEPISGRYVHLDLGGRDHRVYFEEAGSGIPLICLHTAGSDSRQYRAILNDSAITTRYRVIAFDLPWHGRSSPPAGWHRETYVLDTDEYMAIVLAFMKALNLKNPVVMGCSIGGRAVLHLLIRHGREFRAGIGLQSHAGYDPRMRPLVKDLGYLQRPDVNGQEAAAATISGLMAPMSPEADRWETMWHYMQGGPGAFEGDLYYYMVEGDLRNGRLAALDTQICPLYLLTGDYDFSATVQRSRDAARQIPGATLKVMPNLGHFPMSENPPVFLSHLRPVLEQIANK